MKHYSRLLINEPPLQVLPSLAVAVGLNEALFLQQLHYWLEKSKNEKDGFFWVYNTYEEWLDQFPFWSISTLRRTINSLEKAGIVVTGRFNSLKIDKTKWYRIDYKELERVNSPCVQNEQSSCSKWTVEQLNLNRPLPEITTEITTEKVVVSDKPPAAVQNNKPKSKDPAEATRNVFQFYEQNYGLLANFIQQNIGYWLDDFDNNDEIIIEAMKIALKAGKNFNYAEGILKQWHKAGIRTLDAAQAAQTTFDREKGANRTKAVRKDPGNDWGDLLND